MVVPLSRRIIREEDAERLYKIHSGLKASYREFCPTCHKKGFYLWPDEDTKQECDCREQLQYYKHYLNAGIGSLYQRLTWEDLEWKDNDFRSAVDTYRKNIDNAIANGLGFLWMGPVGTGKTMVANLLLKDLLHKGYSVFATTFAGLIDMMTAGWGSNEEKEFFQEKVKKSRVLLIDDLGKEYKTKTGLGNSALDAVLRSRVQEGLVTLITSNISIEEIEHEYGQAIASLIDETSWQINVTGKDFRTNAGIRKSDEALRGLTRPIS